MPSLDERNPGDSTKEEIPISRGDVSQDDIQGQLSTKEEALRAAGEPSTFPDPVESTHFSVQAGTTVSELETDDKSCHEDTILCSIKSEDQGEAQPLLNRPYDEHEDFASLDKAWFIAEANPDHPRAKRLLRLSQRRIILIIATVCAIIVFLANSTALLVLSLKYPGSVIYRGNCQTTSAANTFIHFLVNVLSTTILGCSNLCMQLLVAPTREEVDKAHAKQPPVHLTIGVPSFSNLKHISSTRAAIWCLLIISSLPLHFLYNSAFFATLPVNSYTYLVVQPSFLTGAPVNLTAAWEYANYWQTQVVPGDDHRGLLWKMNSEDFNRLCGDNCNLFRNGSTLLGAPYTQISKRDCLTKYSHTFGNRSDVILVSSQDRLIPGLAERDPLVVVGYNEGPTLTNFWWWGNTPARMNESEIYNWSVFGEEIDYCLSREWNNSDACAVGFSFAILMSVCVANFFKVAGILYTTRIYSKEGTQPLSTLGDALASFLHVNERCTIPLKQTNGIKRKSFRRYQIVSPCRWFWVLIPAALLLVAGVIGAIAAAHGVAVLGSNFVDLGIGRTSEYALSALAGGFSSKPTQDKLYNFVLFANVWQFVPSLIYFQYNGVLSVMLANREWMRYEDRKSIRVTSRKSTTQRTSYFVSMPLRYGGSLLVGSFLLHFFLSLSIFVVPLEQMDKVVPENLMSVALNPLNGFSVWGILTSIAIGVSLILALLFYSSRPFETHMPLRGATDSTVISAACHQPQPLDHDAWLFAVQYGAVPIKFATEYKVVPSLATIDQPKGSLKQETYDVEMQEAGGRKNDTLEGYYLTFTTYRKARRLSQVN